VPKLYAWEKEEFVMEKLNGDTFLELHIKVPLKPNDSRYKSILDGIKTIVDAGWEPGDLKPFHIYFTEDNKVKFIDFTMYFRVTDPNSSFDLAQSDLVTYMDDYEIR
jgi:RIO-like serine/threonine protein kinase